MLTVDQALQLVLEYAQRLPPRTAKLSACLGCMLAEPVTSDVDSPPHDKSVVDGYAVIAADITAPGVELAILEELTAGAMPTRAIECGTATRIMTGAPLPRGADAVVMIEQTKLAGERVAILQSPVRPGQNIMRRAAAMSRGQTVLKAGKLLRPIELGLLAEVGRSQVSVVPPPSLTVLATGNELIDQSAVPGPGQIRNSNGPMLASLAQSAGAEVADLGIARDESDDLRRAAAAGLEQDILVISGGVSAGVLDLVPKTLHELGVRAVFHKVNLKPGKPLWFGVHDKRPGGPALVFGLPGNPVSALVCFALFVLPAIQKFRGVPPNGLRKMTARLARDHAQHGERPTYWPALHDANGVIPLLWQGSGDLRTLTDANCLAFFPAGERVFRAGEEIDLLLLDEPTG